MNSDTLIKTFAIIISSIILITPTVRGQQNSDYKTEIELQAIGTSSKAVPFWMRSNQFGSIPLKGISGSGIIRTSKDYSVDSGINKLGNSRKIMDWGYGLELRFNGGSKSNFQLLETYIKGRVSIFQVKAGRSKDVMGLNGDSSLTSGNFAVSGNALGIPKVELSIPEYWRVPYLKGIFSIKGTFSHGWVGRTQILDSIRSLPPSTDVFYIGDNNPATYLHQKSLYVRLGMKDWRLNLIGGVNHQAYWGNERRAYGPNFKLSSVETFFYVATGKAYGSKGVPSSKIGNQLGSIDLGLEYRFNDVKVMLYRQNFYDVGALSKLANISDGLNGVTIENLNYSSKNSKLQVKKILFELFYSKNQAGYPWSIPTKSGDEDYYNNFYYLRGWSYKNVGLGNPLITAIHDARSGQAYTTTDYFLNNRVVGLNGGLSGSLSNITFTGKATYSWNYGTFGTSEYGSSTGIIRNPQTNNLFIPVQQLSLYLVAEKYLSKSYSVGCATAFDTGHLLENSFGILFNIKKSFR